MTRTLHWINYHKNRWFEDMAMSHARTRRLGRRP